MNVEPVDLGDELRQGAESRLDLPPVVVRPPIAGEFLHGRELHALRLIGDRLLVGPARRRNAPAQVRERLIGSAEAEGADCGLSDGVHRRISLFRGLAGRGIACCGQLREEQAGAARGRRAEEYAAPVRQWRCTRHDHPPVLTLLSLQAANTIADHIKSVKRKLLHDGVADTFVSVGFTVAGGWARGPKRTEQMGGHGDTSVSGDNVTPQLR